MVLEVRRLAAVRPGDGLDVGRPAPARLQHQAPDLGAADTENLRPSVRELADLVGGVEAAMLGDVLSHVGLPCGRFGVLDLPPSK